MSAVVDASSPIRFTGTPAVNVTITSAAFTAPANSLIVVAVNADTSTANDTFVVSDSGSLAWTTQVERNGGETTLGGYAGLFTAPQVSSASRTVSVKRTAVGGTSTNRISCKVYVVTGADIGGTPVDAITANNEGGLAGTTSLTTTSLTPGATGLLFVSDTDWNVSGTFTSTDLTIDHEEDAAQIDLASGWKTCTSGVGVTGNMTAGGATVQHKWSQIIVRQAAGAVATLEWKQPTSQPTDRHARGIVSV